MSREIFETDYFFHGKHVEMVRGLADQTKKNKFFSSYIELFLAAVMTGIGLNRKSEKDKGGEKAVIPYSVLAPRAREIWFLFQLAVLTDPDLKLSSEERFDALYKNENIDPEYTHLFESYLYGGLEYLFDNLYVVGASNSEQVANISLFTGDFDGMLNKSCDLYCLAQDNCK